MDIFIVVWPFSSELQYKACLGIWCKIWRALRQKREKKFTPIPVGKKTTQLLLVWGRLGGKKTHQPVDQEKKSTRILCPRPPQIINGPSLRQLIDLFLGSVIARHLQCFFIYLPISVIYEVKCHLSWDIDAFNMLKYLKGHKIYII